jgi:hypothetical protein
MQNGSIESFNGRFRDECLDPHWFRSLDEARRIIERWRVAYNETRPHTALRMSTPKAFAAARAATASASGSRAVSGLTAGAACRSFHAGAIPNRQIPPMSGPNFGAGSDAPSHLPPWRAHASVNGTNRQGSWSRPAEEHAAILHHPTVAI